MQSSKDAPRRAPRWRVDYHLWVAGGRLMPYSREVRALSEADAIDGAHRLERASARAAGRSDTSTFRHASAERLMSLDEVGS